MKTLMDYFSDIAAIPRPSGHEAAVADYLMAFAKEQGLEGFRDSWENVVIKKPASPGLESAEAVLLQGHTDMVPAAAEGKDFDFLTQPIELIVDGDIVTANGTTLGGDNGVAVVIMLSLLADKEAKHPALECVFTSQEETGLFGATGLDTSNLRAKYMINLDCGPEGHFMTSCAGGMRVNLESALQAEPCGLPVWKLHISGLKSGHSGASIHEERAGALMLCGLALDRLRAAGARLISVVADFKDNVIPSSAVALFALAADPADIVKAFQAETHAAYGVADPDISITVVSASAERMMSERDSGRIIDLLLLLPHGVASLSAAVPGMVETSSNLASAEIGPDKAIVRISLRSSSDDRKQWLFRKVERIGELCGMTVTADSQYPGWIYEKDSPLRERATALYREKYGEEPIVEGIHGGLECGIFKGKMPQLDIIAIGPNGGGHHTIEEWMSISSLERTYDYVKDLLAAMGDMA